MIQVVINGSLQDRMLPPAPQRGSGIPPSQEVCIRQCPVSNFSILGKPVDMVVDAKLQKVLDKANYLDPFQSGFRLSHSTETPLVIFVDYLWR